ncbi:hypothetical protein BDB00DRAFT_950529 [Zychaea mexicana]|uniref:uncharacterized protein n=1 Tax=Zychaea mexicana TaxID=64656 RepID=UPI0022FDB844|nr:uncharacterized protein BDB00DRAFT_950529 [Zychaea mexicana]KAI9498102.1 hypothetical protein BDB00DRAFT_950529 [Zychaea mexicana]
MICNRAFRKVLVTFFLLASLIAIIIPTWKIYSKDGQETTLIAYNAPNIHGESLYISATVLDVDFALKTYRLHCLIKPNGTLANEYGQLNRPIYISFSTLASYHIGAGDANNPINAMFSYHLGDNIDYPFDHYSGTFEVYASYANDTAHTIPITFHLKASLTSFAFKPTLVDPEPNESDRVSLQIETGRSPTTVGFSIFTCVLMWALSLVLTLFAYQVIIQRRKVDAHACMVGVSMLFAMPALRSAQPGAPEIGCTSDILSFYWNMAIIAIDSIAIIICWVVRWSGNNDSPHNNLSTRHDSDASDTSKDIQHIERLNSINTAIV